ACVLSACQSPPPVSEDPVQPVTLELSPGTFRKYFNINVTVLQQNTVGNRGTGKVKISISPRKAFEMTEITVGLHPTGYSVWVNDYYKIDDTGVFLESSPELYVTVFPGKTAEVTVNYYTIDGIAAYQIPKLEATVSVASVSGSITYIPDPTESERVKPYVGTWTALNYKNQAFSLTLNEDGSGTWSYPLRDGTMQNQTVTWELDNDFLLVGRVGATTWLVLGYKLEDGKLVEQETSAHSQINQSGFSMEGYLSR
ncbi:MAG: hypothetical protein IKM08_08060, partial [Clostridia bacterium]|nr:hypothetical protein [Clostridia bacterium]